MFGQAEIRPYIPYSWRYSVFTSGPFSHAETSGGVELSAWRRSDGGIASVQGVRRKQLFRKAAGPYEAPPDQSEDGVIPLMTFWWTSLSSRARAIG